MGNRLRTLGIIPLIFLFSFSSVYAESSFKKIARFISEKAVGEKKMRIAVLTYVPLKDKDMADGEVISEEIIVELVNLGKVSVVERAQVAKILKELEFHQTGAIDAVTARKIGNGLGADALVIGSYTRLNQRQVKLFTKLVDTETFQVLGASQETVERSSGKPAGQAEDNPDVLVNRRVLILDFVNINDSPDYKYLEKSIPESFLDSLDKTRKFEIMDRSIWTEAMGKEKYDKKDADNEKVAVSVGRKYGGDVVLVGSFVVIGNQMQIFAKAIELTSKRVMVSRNINSPLDSTIFAAIKKLTTDMADQMKEKLPPLPQKVITVEREKYILEETITYGGMIWRTAVLPGWGHLYANEWRGWIYMPLFAGTLGTFTAAAIDFAIKDQAYQSATSGLEAAYAAMRDARLVRNIGFVSMLGVYAVSMADILIFGKMYEKVPELSGEIPVRYYAYVLPEFMNRGSEWERGLYVEFRIEARY